MKLEVMTRMQDRYDFDPGQPGYPESEILKKCDVGTLNEESEMCEIKPGNNNRGSRTQ